MCLLVITARSTVVHDNRAGVRVRVYSTVAVLRSGGLRPTRHPRYNLGRPRYYPGTAYVVPRGISNETYFARKGRGGDLNRKILMGRPYSTRTRTSTSIRLLLGFYP